MVNVLPKGVNYCCRCLLNTAQKSTGKVVKADLSVSLCPLKTYPFLTVEIAPHVIPYGEAFQLTSAVCLCVRCAWSLDP